MRGFGFSETEKKQKGLLDRKELITEELRVFDNRRKSPDTVASAEKADNENITINPEDTADFL